MTSKCARRSHNLFIAPFLLLSEEVRRLCRWEKCCWETIWGLMKEMVPKPGLQQAAPSPVLTGRLADYMSALSYWMFH